MMIHLLEYCYSIQGILESEREHGTKAPPCQVQAPRCRAALARAPSGKQGLTEKACRKEDRDPKGDEAA